jgi:hypothetical protein
MIKNQCVKMLCAGNPFVCLAVFGVYVSTGEAGLASITTHTSLLQQYLVAMATGFCRRLMPELAGKPGDGGGGELSPELMAALSLLQQLAYVTLVTLQKLLRDGDLEGAAQRLRACALQAYSGNFRASTVSFSTSTFGTSEPQTNQATVNGQTEATGGGGGEGGGGAGGGGGGGGGGGSKGKNKGQSPASMSDSALLLRIGLVARVGGASWAQWAFPCGMLREFLAARHLADLNLATLEKELDEQKVNSGEKIVWKAQY